MMTKPLKVVTQEKIEDAMEKSLPIDKEAMFLFLSTAFAQMYYDGVKTKRKDVAKLIAKLGKNQGCLRTDCIFA